MSISRRSFVMGAMASVVAPYHMASEVSGDVGEFPNQLKIPPLLEPNSGLDGKIYELVAAAGKTEFVPGVLTPTIGFNGSYLGPTIRCRVGDRLMFRIKNSLSEKTTAHWHGLHVPARFDGGRIRLSSPEHSGSRRLKSSKSLRYAGTTLI